MPTKKEQFLEQIKSVKAAHKKLMESIHLTLNGITTDYYKPVSKYECKFGKWLYDGDLQKIILGPQIYERLENTHALWHQTYAKIYNLLFPEKKGIGKFFGGKPKSQDLDKAKAYYDDLQQLTDKLMRELEVAQKRVQALSESKFN